MRKFYCFSVIALGIMLLSCSNDFENLQKESINANVRSAIDTSSGDEEIESYLDFVPNEEYFINVGNLHNDFLDEILNMDILSTLPYASDGKTIPVEIELLQDVIYQKAYTFFTTAVNFSGEEIGYFNYRWNDGTSKINYLEYPMLAPECVREYWYMLASIVNDESIGDDSYDELDALFTDIYSRIDMEHINEYEFSFLCCLSLARGSAAYWNEDKVLEYMNLYKLNNTDIFEEIDIYAPSFRMSWWKADLIGGGLGAFGGLLGILLGGASASACYCINEYLLPELIAMNIVNIEDGRNTYMYYKDEIVINAYRLFYFEGEPENPYLTGDYMELSLPNDLFY